MSRRRSTLLRFISTLLLSVFSAHGCQLPSEWRPLSEGCRAELAEIIVFARVLDIRPQPRGVESLFSGFGAEEGLLYSAEVELLCDQSWGSMLEVPSGSRLNLTGLGYLPCQSHTVTENESYFFFLRMDENYNILPHSINFQDAIFPDTAENRRTFSGLFQFSNCTQERPLIHGFGQLWDQQEDSRVGHTHTHTHTHTHVRSFSPNMMVSDLWVLKLGCSSHCWYMS
ncbi:coiled-coil domain-containing protein 3a [Cynoglossus semilaevis]|uniref:coiled-coil domain-containing protein 3a n=1 Tax=Cynoglossus semilaevis TaxID=244447 RepID=UPI000D62E614|nr:coiled-coil domain-containing protein 3 [Cynoglossus semilaevis]